MVWPLPIAVDWYEPLTLSELGAFQPASSATLDAFQVALRADLDAGARSNSRMVANPSVEDYSCRSYASTFSGAEVAGAPRI